MFFKYLKLFLMIVCASIFAPSFSDAKLLTHCEFVHQLRKYGVPKWQIPTLSCIAYWESNYNSSKVDFERGKYGKSPIILIAYTHWEIRLVGFFKLRPISWFEKFISDLLLLLILNKCELTRSTFSSFIFIKQQPITYTILKMLDYLHQDRAFILSRQK